MGEKFNGDLGGVIRWEGMAFFSIPGEPVDLKLGTSSTQFGRAPTELSLQAGVVFKSI